MVILMHKILSCRTSCRSGTHWCICDGPRGGVSATKRTDKAKTAEEERARALWWMLAVVDIKLRQNQWRRPTGNKASFLSY